MSVFKMFSGGEKVRKEPGQQDDTDREQLLIKKTEFLKKKIDQELLYAKKNSRKNRRDFLHLQKGLHVVGGKRKSTVALQALRRKKWYEKHLKYIDCAVKAMKSAHEHIDIVNKVNDLIRDITEEQDGTQNMSDTLYTSVSFGVEFDEDELLAELERLDNNLDESLFEKDRAEEGVLCPVVSSTASPPEPGKMEEDEVEEALEVLRRWANESS